MTTDTVINAASLANAFRAANALTRKHSRTFYFATRLLPVATRSAIRALYLFCRSTDDLVDLQQATPADVAAWRAQVALPAALQPDARLSAWAHVREQYGVNSRFEHELIDGVALDLTQRRYQTWADLEHYCYLVASTVGLLSLPIIGLAPGVAEADAATYAIRMGIALQLTNILRDVGEDAARGHIYIPQADLHDFNLTSQDIFDGVHDARFVALMQFEIGRARQIYRAALPGIALLAPAARVAVGAAALLYAAILERIEATDYHVHTERARTTDLEKLLRLPGIFAYVQRLRHPDNSARLRPPIKF